ncbi:MAG: universal stress protein [Pyrinomonadaceae bacterium]
MRILIATDGSDFSSAAVKKACEFVNPANDTVKVISVLEDVPPIVLDPTVLSSEYYQTIEDNLREMASQHVAAATLLIQKHFEGKSVDVSGETLHGFADERIIDEARSWKADLIVVGSHGRGFWGRFLGSVSNGVVHHAPCSVLVVRKPDVETAE